MSRKKQPIPLVSDIGLSPAEEIAIFRAAQRWPEASSFCELNILRRLDSGFSDARVYEAEWVSPGSAANDRVILKVDAASRLTQEVRFSHLFKDAAPSFMKVRSASFEDIGKPPDEFGCIFYAHAGGQFPGEIKTLSSLCEDALAQKAGLDEFVKLLANTFAILRLQLQKGTNGPAPASAKAQLDYYLKRWWPAAELECRQVSWSAPGRLRLFLADHPAEEFPDLGRFEEADLGMIDKVVAFNASELCLTDRAIYVNQPHARCFHISGILPGEVKALVGEATPEVRVEGRLLRTRLSSYQETFKELGLDPKALHLRFGNIEIPNPLLGFQARVERWSRRQPLPTYCFGHGDLHGGNVLCVGGTLAMIDHALSGEGHPAWADAARLIGSLWRNSVAPWFQTDDLALILTLAFRQQGPEPTNDSTVGFAATLLRKAYESAVAAGPSLDDSRRELWIDLHHFSWIGLKWGGSREAQIAMILLAGVAVEKIEHESRVLVHQEKLRSSLPSRFEPSGLLQDLPEHLSYLGNFVREIAEPDSELLHRYREVLKELDAEQLRHSETNAGRTGGLLGRLLDKALTRSWTYQDTTDASRIRLGEDGLYTPVDRVILADVLLFACLFTWTDEAFALVLDLCNEGDGEVETEAALVLAWLVNLETTRHRFEARPSLRRRVQALLSRREMFDFFSMAGQVRLETASLLPSLTQQERRNIWAHLPNLSEQRHAGLLLILREEAARLGPDTPALLRCRCRTLTLAHCVHALQQEGQQDEIRQLLLASQRSFADLLTDEALKQLALARELTSAGNLAIKSNEKRQAQGLLRRSIRYLEQAAGNTLLVTDDLLSWGNQLGQLADLAPDIKAQRELRSQACDKYQRALQVKPDKHEALHNWGIQLSLLAALAPDTDAQREFRIQACHRYQQALQVKPDKHEALFNWGCELSLLAALAPDTDTQRELRIQVCDKYQRSLQVKPDTHEALYNWGVELSRQADLAPDIDAQRELRIQACDKYQLALQVKPDKYEALINWGNQLSRQADLAPDIDAQRNLRIQACDKYRLALQVKPDTHEALNNWGNQLSQLAVVSEPKEREKLWGLAGELLAQVAGRRGIPLAQVYNYACLLALRHQKSEALASLKKCIEASEVTVAYVRQDSDWSEFRGDPDFEALLGPPSENDAVSVTPR